MSKRTCANCGKDKDLKNGKVCEKGHFICAECNRHFSFCSQLKKCPLDGTKLE
jgi:hypothetical protein